MLHIERFLGVLKTESAILIVLLLALVAQIPHAASVFASVAHPAPMHSVAWFVTWFGAITYAIALEAATLVFVLRGKWAVSAAFAGVSIAVNLCYYFAADGAWWAAALVSVALPLAIALYSHDLSGAHPQLPKLRAVVPGLQSKERPIAVATPPVQPESKAPKPAQSVEKQQPERTQSNDGAAMGLNDTQVAAVRVIYHNPHIEQAAIASEIGKAASTVSRALSPLKKNGLIDETPDGWRVQPELVTQLNGAIVHG